MSTQESQQEHQDLVQIGSNGLEGGGGGGSTPTEMRACDFMDHQSLVGTPAQVQVQIAQSDGRCLADTNNMHVNSSNLAQAVVEIVDKSIDMESNEIANIACITVSLSLRLKPYYYLLLIT